MTEESNLQDAAPVRPGLILELAQAAKILFDANQHEAADELVQTIRWLNKPAIVPVPAHRKA
jgi:hypothetical protein